MIFNHGRVRGLINFPYISYSAIKVISLKLFLDTVSSSFVHIFPRARVLRGCFHGRWKLGVKSLGLYTWAETWIISYLNAGLGFCPSYGAVSALLAGAKLRGCILGCASVGSALACTVIAKKLSDHLKVWNEVEDKRKQHDQLSDRLKSLEEKVQKELKEDIEKCEWKGNKLSQPTKNIVNALDSS